MVAIAPHKGPGRHVQAYLAQKGSPVNTVKALVKSTVRKHLFACPAWRCAQWHAVWTAASGHLPSALQARAGPRLEAKTARPARWAGTSSPCAVLSASQRWSPRRPEGPPAVPRAKDLTAATTSGTEMSGTGPCAGGNLSSVLQREQPERRCTGWQP